MSVIEKTQRIFVQISCCIQDTGDLPAPSGFSLCGRPVMGREAARDDCDEAMEADSGRARPSAVTEPAGGKAQRTALATNHLRVIPSSPNIFMVVERVFTFPDNHHFRLLPHPSNITSTFYYRPRQVNELSTRLLFR